MKAVILCGGKGTRIRDVTENVPKPMLPIGDRPILWHIMKGYAAHGIEDFVLCLGYKSWAVKEFFLNYRAMSSDVTVSLGGESAIRYDASPLEQWRVTLAETGIETMTGARVAAIRRYVEEDDAFCLTYGDGVADIDVGRLLAFHREHGRVATLSAVRPVSRFGELSLDGSAVREFREKPRATSGLINGGFFVFDAKRIWPYLAGGDDLVLEREPLQRLAAEGQLMAYIHEGFWEPMDTQREYTMLNELWASGKAPWRTW
jgi:glucose-1-phosphate cytidylyltransferase